MIISQPFNFLTLIMEALYSMKKSSDRLNFISVIYTSPCLLWFVKVRKLQTTHYNSYMSNYFKCKPVNTEMNHIKKKKRDSFSSSLNQECYSTNIPSYSHN